MKFTLSWLKDHLDTDASPEAIAETLTRIGLEVEGVENPAEALKPFRIARVLTAAPHPQADKLQLLSVDAGSGPQQVVCGAPNARAGLVGVFGAPGAYVPGLDVTLKVASIRGVESRGMMCSSRELELGDDHSGIIELPEDAPIGAVYAEWAKLDDVVFDISVTPNRQDCMGVRGIARDLAAAGIGTLKPIAVPTVPAAFPCPVEIRTEDPEGCPAFHGRVIRGVRNGSSPDWMQRRLKAVGQRPISTIVDITNYLMIDQGRPSHAYDLAKLHGAVVARRARSGETVEVLNGRSYTLTPDMTVIADDVEVHDVAGIMGGAHSGVEDGTTDLLLEVAFFDPERIARTGQALGLTSDARSRFERGVDPAFLEDGLALLSALILEHCGGTASEVVRAGDAPVPQKRISYDPALAARLGGVSVPTDEQRAILERLGFAVEPDGERLTVIPPSWRRDVDGAADIVEEVVRMVGLDAVQSVPLTRDPGVAKPTATAEQLVERRVRRAAAARGLHEAVTWSFLSEAEADAFGGGAWTLANPISEDLKVMRPSLLPGLLSAARRNADRGAAQIRLFEVGRRYLADAERPTVGFVLGGDRTSRSWATGKAQGFDAFDAKAEAIALLGAAGAPVENLQLMGEASASYHPGRSATLRLGPKTILAEFGVLHPALAKTLDLPADMVAGEVFLDALPGRRDRGPSRTKPTFAPPALQAVTRDFAFLLPDGISADQLVRAIKGADKALITGARVFDLFTGHGVPKDHRSVAVEVTLQPSERSFDEAALAGVSDKVVAAAGKLGATLRG
ncbi:phenylalanyl-tRNA synthetase beta chain [Sphingomonas jejuensis]|uniref:Phenylalanine--tRNA ligase beta subunit n=1 Tax=Sphingomonas jejuensis TaxID=904715 RepID=A0ABX0XQG8_9SPHN|nr:phenylalanine--tRNA ligase subunit beta [Sphingomonas jejuensis]NJC34925.1 phenylalanyl-tRNA synthetase beta chain [Sphingomonas jejuensis]